MPDSKMNFQNDLTFFTNQDESDSLLGRFKTTLRGVEFFDILVGYFRIGGFHLLQDALQDVAHIRILVGLNVDPQTYAFIDIS